MTTVFSGFDPDQLSGLTGLRRELHKYPELSGQERETAAKIADELLATSPDQLLIEMGGNGVAAIYAGQEPGPTVLVRCELDGLPIAELSELPYRSLVPGRGHLCGHDGHMAIAIGVAKVLGDQRPRSGTAVVLFQPAEETGAGAKAVVADPRYRELAPDYVFSLHNVPGIPLGHVAIMDGVVNCASLGMKFRLSGKTSHASEPDDGNSPALVIAELLTGLTQLGTGGPLHSEFTLVTVTHATMGAAGFGISPGEGEVWATLRCVTDEAMDVLTKQAEKLAADLACQAGLVLEITFHDVFDSCENNPEATQRVEQALTTQGVRLHPMEETRRWSEDFGQYGQAGAKAAMFFLGAGKEHPQLHNPDYDFPDALVPIGAGVFLQILRDVLG